MTAYNFAVVFTPLILPASWMEASFSTQQMYYRSPPADGTADDLSKFIRAVQVWIEWGFKELISATEADRKARSTQLPPLKATQSHKLIRKKQPSQKGRQQPALNETPPLDKDKSQVFMDYPLLPNIRVPSEKSKLRKLHGQGWPPESPSNLDQMMSKYYDEKTLRYKPKRSSVTNLPRSSANGLVGWQVMSSKYLQTTTGISISLKKASSEEIPMKYLASSRTHNRPILRKQPGQRDIGRSVSGENQSDSNMALASKKE